MTPPARPRKKRGKSLADCGGNRIFTSAFQRKGYGERIPDEVTLEDGSHQKVKYLRLTQMGLDLDPDAQE